MTDEDIFAFRPVPGPAPAAARRPWRIWPWALGAVVVLLALAASAAALALVSLGDSVANGLHIVIGGDSWEPPVLLDGDHWGAVVLGLAAAGVALVLVVPLALLVGVAGSALGIGIALLVLLVVAAVLLVPLWLPGLLLWLLLRNRRAPAAGVSA